RFLHGWMVEREPGRRLRRGGWNVAVAHQSAGEIRVEPAQLVSSTLQMSPDTDGARRRNSPGSERLAADAIGEARLALDDQHPRPTLRHPQGERRTTKAAADGDQVVRGHAVALHRTCGTVNASPDFTAEDAKVRRGTRRSTRRAGLAPHRLCEPLRSSAVR